MSDVISDVFYCKYLILFTLFCREILPQFARFYMETNWVQKYICGVKNGNYEACL